MRHICPAMASVPLTGAATDVARLAADVAALADLIDPDLSFSVQTRILAATAYKPFDVNTTLADQVAAHTGAPVNVRAGPGGLGRHRRLRRGHAGPGHSGGLAHGLQPVGLGGGMRRFACEPDQISRRVQAAGGARRLWHRVAAAWRCAGSGGVARRLDPRAASTRPVRDRGRSGRTGPAPADDVPMCAIWPSPPKRICATTRTGSM
ncbi:MAG: hypothetical protein R3A10_12490 [Caldilineaceae bacterium]